MQIAMFTDALIHRYNFLAIFLLSPAPCISLLHFCLWGCLLWCLNQPYQIWAMFGLLPCLFGRVCFGNKVNSPMMFFFSGNSLHANVCFLVFNVLRLFFLSQGSDPLPGKASQNGDTKPVPSTNMIRSQSATGSLHGAQHNPVAADILRKEPEHETFSRINITAVGMVHFSRALY